MNDNQGRNLQLEVWTKSGGDTGNKDNLVIRSANNWITYIELRTEKLIIIRNNEKVVLTLGWFSGKQVTSQVFLQC